MGDGREWGRWVRQACIGRSVILNYQVCRDNRRLIGWMDDVMCGGEGGGGMGRCACRRAVGRVSLQSPLVSPTTPPPSPARRRLTGDGWAGWRPSARRRSLVPGVWLRTKTTLLQFYEQFHAVTKYVNTVICNNIAVTCVKSWEISQ